MEIIHGNEQEFKSLIQDELVLVDFFATWCGPCKMLTPVLEELASTRSDMKIVKIDVDQNPNLSKEFAIITIQKWRNHNKRTWIYTKTSFRKLD